MLTKTTLQSGKRAATWLPSPALALAIVALVVALAGTSLAAFSLPANSVGASQIRNRSITNSKLQDGLVTSGKLHNRAVTSVKIAGSAVTSGKLQAAAVTSVKLRDAAVTSGKLQNGAITSAKLAPSAITATNVPAGAGVKLTYTFGQVSVSPGQGLSAHVSCPGGNNVVGGGMTAGATSVVTNDSAPFNSQARTWTGSVADSWGVFVTNTDTTAAHDVGIYAICIVASTVR